MRALYFVTIFFTAFEFYQEVLKKIIWITLNFFLASRFGQSAIGLIIHTSLVKNLALTASVEDPSRFLLGEVCIRDGRQQFAYVHKLQLCPPASETPECIAVVFCH